VKCFLCYLLEEDDELADLPIPLTANLTVVTCRAGEGLIRELFEPLAYSVVAEQHPLDEKFPEWGEGPPQAAFSAATRSASAHFKPHWLRCRIDVRIVIFVYARCESLRVDRVFCPQSVAYLERIAWRDRVEI